MPGRVKPMLAVDWRGEPFDQPGWFFEVKWDGFRGMARIVGKEADLYARETLRPFRFDFSLITDQLRALKTPVLLDGEVVLLDQTGHPDFQALRRGQFREDLTLSYMVFDILYVKKYNVCSLPLRRRKEILKEVLPQLPNVVECDYKIKTGENYFRTFVLPHHLEGMIAKDGKSPYRMGERSDEWLKIKRYIRHGWNETVEREFPLRVSVRR